MAEEHGICPDMEVEGGGVPLTDLNSLEEDYTIEASSPGLSASVMSDSPTHSAQESLVDPETNSLPPMDNVTQHNTLQVVQASSISSDILEQASEDAGSSSQPQMPMIEAIAPQYEATFSGSVSQDLSTIGPNIIDPINPPDLWFMEIQGSEIIGQGDAPISVSNEEDLIGTPLMPNSSSNDEDATLLATFHYYLPTIHNVDIEHFLHLWRLLYLQRKVDYPCTTDTGGSSDVRHRNGRVSAKSMERASCTIQGIKWSRFQTSSSSAREMRRMTYRNFINMPHLNYEQPLTAYATRDFKACFKSDFTEPLSKTDRFFRFRETNLKHVPEYMHNQLRHCVSAGSKNAVYFYNRMAPDDSTPYIPHLPKVRCLNPGTDSVRDVIDLRQSRGSEFFKQLDIACINAGHGLLIVGALREGHYAMKSLSSTCDEPYVQGIFNSSGHSAGINHVHTFLHRHSGVPYAVFCDNDAYIRVIDCNTTKQVHAQKWTSLVNCSATSPDGRLRIHVSDDQWPIVAEAETGQAIAKLPGHKDHGFACDWSPDGITMATGHQDGVVLVWDARKMTKAVHVLPAEMGGIRSLHFSPLGSGHPILVMAEPADYVSIVDARTFQSKQDIEFFGEIAGVSMPSDGTTIYIGNADPRYGGIIEFERTGYTGQFKHKRLRCSSLQQRKNQRRQAVYNASPDDSDCENSVEEASAEAKLKRKWKLDDQDATIWQTREHDWVVDADMVNDKRAVLSRKQRWHRHLGLERLVF